MDKSFNSQYNTPNESTGFLLWRVEGLWHRQQNAALKQFNLTHSQFVLLASIGWLSSQKGLEITQNRLAEHTTMNVMVVSQIIRTLIKKKLIHRISHPLDTRANLISLTAEGAILLGKSLKKVEQTDITFFQNVNTKQLNPLLINLIKS